MHRYSTAHPIFLILFMLLSAAATADQTISVRATVLRVIDGDTVVLSDERARTYTLRLAAIDAPERKQHFGAEARAALADLQDQSVTVELQQRDRYRRHIGRLWLGQQDIGLRQIKQGWAWHYTRYAVSQTVSARNSYTTTEQEAREHKRGLWHDSNPMPPWEFRQKLRQHSRN